MKSERQKTMTRTYISPRDKREKLCYDYDKQVWIKDGKYVNCGHPDGMNCGCYGKNHAGEDAIITDACM